MNASSTRGVGSCPLCWGSNHRCFSTTRGHHCKNCSNQIIRGINDTHVSIAESPPLNVEAIKQILFEHGWQASLPSMYMYGIDQSTWSLDFKSSSSPPVETSLYFGKFTSQNEVSLDALDSIILEHFAAKLKDKRRDTGLIMKAALAGGYLHLLCSSSDIKEHVQTFINGVSVRNGYSNYLLALQFRYLLMVRLGDLVAETMAEIRLGARFSHPPTTYAAATILHKEVKYFRASLKYGTLSERVPLGLKSIKSPELLESLDADGPFLDWLSSLKTELEHRLREGCGRFKSWGLSIHGSMKIFKSLRHKGETITIIMHLQQNLVETESIELWRQLTSGLAIEPTLAISSPSSLADSSTTSQTTRLASFQRPRSGSSFIATSSSQPTVSTQQQRTLPCSAFDPDDPLFWDELPSSRLEHYESSDLINDLDGNPFEDIYPSQSTVQSFPPMNQTLELSPNTAPGLDLYSDWHNFLPDNNLYYGL